MKIIDVFFAKGNGKHYMGSARGWLGGHTDTYTQVQKLKIGFNVALPTTAYQTIALKFSDLNPAVKNYQVVYKLASVHD
jgi:hypothetical protein